MSLIVRCLMKDVNSKKIGKENMLDKWLSHVCSFADKVIIVDDNSTDGTYEKCKSYSDKIKIIESKVEDFYTEEQWMHLEVWNLVRKHAKRGDWILALDSDEFLEEYFIENREELMKDQTSVIYCFEFIHMWDLKNFRTDSYWGNKWTHRLFKFIDEEFKPKIKNGLHLSGMPQYTSSLKRINLECGIIHYGYHTKEMREFKSKKYQEYGDDEDKKCASTILEKPTLMKLETRGEKSGC